MDENGNLFFVRRKAESIRKRGYNISIAEIERTIRTDEKVLECVAYGVPDDFGQEEEVMVAIRPRDDVSLTASVISFLSLRLLGPGRPHFTHPKDGIG